MNKFPLLSVCMITYGHEKFIRQAIESILMQQTKFDFELIITNDCSPDDTTAVVNDILKTHAKAKCIRYIEHSENKGMYGNFLFTLNECKGKYIALCEGDDYWIDPLKLQKQVDFLESHSDYEVCFTNIQIIDDNETVVKEQLIPSDRKTVFEQKHLPTWAPTLTRVFKNRDFSQAIPNVPGLDTIMLLYQSKFGKLKLIHEITGVYRRHNGGIYSSLSVAEQRESIILTLLESLKIVDKELLPKYFGLLFKKLIELKVLDKTVFKRNSSLIKKAYKTQKQNLSFITRSKIQMSFMILLLPISKTQTFFLRVIDKLFIY